MSEIGNQYPKDDKTDPTGFLKRARHHQSKFRAEVLNIDYDTYGNYLTKTDGEAGKNFYDKLGVFEAVKKKYRKYNKPLYSNMLRSEHIPFNLFIPLDKNKELGKEIFNEFMDGIIKSIDRIEIEHAPGPKENYLDDRTSFDAYFEYTHIDGSKGIIGIEVKYTEKEYKLPKDSKQEKDINNKNSNYYSVTDKCGLYKPNTIEKLTTDKFRQVWRNHILGESILLVDFEKFTHFTSLTIFPKGNEHFVQISKEYIELLSNNDNNFIPLTYENYFIACEKHIKTDDYKEWIKYLKNRYLVAD